MSMKMPEPKPVPRKRNVTSKSSSSLPKTVSASDLEVKGLRSTLDEMSMQQLREIPEDAGALHNLILSLNVPQVSCKHRMFMSVLQKILLLSLIFSTTLQYEDYDYIGVWHFDNFLPSVYFYPIYNHSLLYYYIGFWHIRCVV